MDDCKKIPTITAFYKLFFSHVNVKGLLNVTFWWLFGYAHLPLSNSHRKYHFRLLLDSFLTWTSPYVVKFNWNVEQWCNARYCIKYVKVFIVPLKTGWNLAKKIILTRFSFMPSYALRVTSRYFNKLKTLLRYIIVLRFIITAFVVVKIKIFKDFHTDSASMKWHLFWSFRALTSLNVVQSEIFTKGSLEVDKNIAPRIFQKFAFWLKRVVSKIYSIG